MLFIVDDRIIFHMHMHTYEIACFCIFLACVFDLHIIDSFRRCVIAPLVYNSENVETVFGGERVKKKSNLQNIKVSKSYTSLNLL